MDGVSYERTGLNGASVRFDGVRLWYTRLGRGKIRLGYFILN